MNKQKKPKKITGFIEWKAQHIAVLFIVPFLLYIQTIGFDFSYNDDDIMILNSANTLSHFDLTKIFFSDAWMLDKKIELYRPFQTFTYAVDYLFTGTDASGYHFHNLLIYCLSIVLLYFFLVTIIVDTTTAFFLALIYSVHFLMPHVVCWIPARGDLYLFAFSISSFITSYLYYKSNNLKYYILTLLLYFLALLSKESAIMVLPLLYLIGYLFYELDLKKIKSYTILISGIPITIIYLWMRSQSIYSGAKPLSIDGLIYNLPALPEEVFKFFIPAYFSVWPSYSVVLAVIGLALIIFLLFIILYFRNKIRRNLIFIGCLFFILPLLPTLFYKPSFSGFAYDYLDHRMFFPGVGLLLVSYSIYELLNKNKLGMNYLYSIIFCSSALAFYNSTNYRNYVSYYNNATETSINSGLAWMNYGTCLAKENKLNASLEKFYSALKASPKNVELHMKIADTYFNTKDYKKMIEFCRAAILLEPKNPKPYFNIATYYSDKNNYDSALKYINLAVEKDSLNADAYFYHGIILKKFPPTERIAYDFTKAIQLNSDYSSSYFERGDFYGKTGRYKEALSDFNNYVKLNPNDGNGYFYRGQAYCMTGNIGTGCEDLHIADKMGVVEARGKISYWCK